MDVVYFSFPQVVTLEPEIVVLVAVETSVVLVCVLEMVWVVPVPELFFCWM